MVSAARGVMVIQTVGGKAGVVETAGLDPIKEAMTDLYIRNSWNVQYTKVRPWFGTAKVLSMGAGSWRQVVKIGI
jgi:hypothetical protein